MSAEAFHPEHPRRFLRQAGPGPGEGLPTTHPQDRPARRLAMPCSIWLAPRCSTRPPHFGVTSASWVVKNERRTPWTEGMTAHTAASSLSTVTRAADGHPGTARVEPRSRSLPWNRAWESATKRERNRDCSYGRCRTCVDLQPFYELVRDNAVIGSPGRAVFRVRSPRFRGVFEGCSTPSHVNRFTFDLGIVLSERFRAYVVEQGADLHAFSTLAR